jgi:hypothetical protein
MLNGVLFIQRFTKPVIVKYNIKMHDWQTDILLKNLVQLIVPVTSVLLKLSRTSPLVLIISIKYFFY